MLELKEQSLLCSEKNACSYISHNPKSVILNNFIKRFIS